MVTAVFIEMLLTSFFTARVHAEMILSVIANNVQCVSTLPDEYVIGMFLCRFGHVSGLFSVNILIGRCVFVCLCLFF